MVTKQIPSLSHLTPPCASRNIAGKEGQQQYLPQTVEGAAKLGFGAEGGNTLQKKIDSEFLFPECVSDGSTRGVSRRQALTVHIFGR